jgi:Uma2 family endonuclease
LGQQELIMADAACDIPRMTANEYLQMEKQATCRHEFVNGVVCAMAGGSREHDFISGDLYAALLAQLRQPCQIFTSDMKMRIKAVTDECYYYPDTSVTCSDLDNDRYALTHPSLIVEVLSHSTEQADRSYKFDHYRLLPSLQEYVLVHQERPCVETHRRRTSWARETFEPDASITFESINLALPVGAFYRRVSF